MSLKAQDQVIRRNWLITYLGCFIYSLIVMLALCLKNAPLTDGKYMLISSISMFVAFIGVGYTLYHFAYRKQGTKFLTAVIIFGALNLCYTVYAPFSSAPLQMPLSLHLISVILSFILMFFHCRLLQVNRRFRASGN